MHPSSFIADAATGEARKVKLAGRRRLCKFAATTTHQLEELEEEEEEEEQQEQKQQEEDDGKSSREILDDLTSRLDSLSVHKPNPTARPREEQLGPLLCNITVDPDDQSAEDGAHTGASSPIQISSSDEAATTITRRAEVKPQSTSVASASDGSGVCTAEELEGS